ncbi:tetratricopeptide repeat protein, partial [Streptomyces sp. NPDC005474]|uniref:tetratricopeptide repeat protein n=1 Tax=Streptomyces sp. NPDC005474 TaxID=3154878 RepID=UPI003452E499
AHEAVRLYTTLAHTSPAAYLPDLAMSLNNLALRLANVGDRQRALEPAHEAVRIRRTLAETSPAAHLPDLAMSLNNLANHLADVGDEAAAIQAYTEAATSLAPVHPAAGRSITFEREVFQLGLTEPACEAGLRGMIRLLNDGSAEQPAETNLRVRQALRPYARKTPRNRQRLERLWQQETDTPLPDWLSLPEETLESVLEWMSTPTWSDSQEFWERHADTLSSDAAMTALDEYALVTSIAEQHQELRKLILSESAHAVFQELILRDQLTEWLACETWDDSKSFLQEHSALLLTESAEDHLAATEPLSPDVETHAAILHMARTESIDTAFQHIQDRDALQQYVLRAVNEGSADSLFYAAAIESAVFQDETSAVTHAQAALLLSGTPDALEALDPDHLATTAANGDVSPDTRNRLVSELATLSALHGSHHTTHWMSLVQALTRTT